MNLRPLGSFVFVKPLKQEDEEEKTEGGLYVVSFASKKESVAKVLAVGDGVEFPDGTKRELRVKAGDTVLYDSHAGVPVKLDGKDVLILRENDIYGVLV